MNFAEFQFTAINNASGFECSFSFGNVGTYGGVIGKLSGYGSYVPRYGWNFEKTQDISFPFGTSSANIVNGPKKIVTIGNNSVQGNTVSYASFTPTVNISAKGSGTVTIYGQFTYGSDNLPLTTIDTTKPHIRFDISSGSLTSYSTNLRIDSTSPFDIRLYAVDSIVVS